MRFTGRLGLERCPHCNVDNPTIDLIWQPTVTSRGDGERRELWGAFGCSSCGSLVTTRCRRRAFGDDHAYEVVDIYPSVGVADRSIPPVPRRYLQQAIDVLHAPDACTIMAGTAVGAMLAELNYRQGSVYERIEAAVADRVLTDGLGRWSRAVRLEARSVDDDAGAPASVQEALRAIEFARALGDFLFVLAVKVEHGIASGPD